MVDIVVRARRKSLKLIGTHTFLFFLHGSPRVVDVSFLTPVGR